MHSTFIKIEMTLQNLTIILNIKGFVWIVFAFLYEDVQTGRLLGRKKTKKKMNNDTVINYKLVY